MHRTRTIAGLLAVGALLVACGDDTTGPADTTVASTTTTLATTTLATTTTAASTTTSVAPTTSAATTTTAAVTTTAAPTTTGSPTTTTAVTTTLPGGLEQPAIWPAADVVFLTPEEAATDFVTEVLGVPPVLGPFQAGDALSGEIEVFSAGEGGGGTPTPRGLLLLRRLGRDMGWFITAAANEFASISSPEAGAVVTAGPLDVEGKARGFEANVVVQAFVAGTKTVIDSEITMGGALETAEPYSVTLDLSDVPSGTIVMLIVRGGVGLETDPGEFGAIPVVIGS